MATVTLQYESARQAQQLFDNNPANLRLLEEELEIQATSRDGWIKLEGDDDNLAQAQDVFASLKDQLDTGQRPRQRDLVKAIQTVKEDGGEALRGLKSQTITTSPRKPSVIPKTVGQKEYIQAITTHDITFGVGPAGTGKTYLAMAMAVSALQRGDVSRIILTRPAVEAGEALGFLPGDLREKLSPYLRPLHDALLDMIPVEEVQRHMERETIEIAPLAYMRGRTLNNAFVILDEAQNTTNEQMFMFLTRLGYHSKAIVTGDPTQIDLPPSKQSGLLEALLTLRKTEGVAIKKFAQNDVVRHPLVQKIINAYETRRNRE
ncbi:MAG TPA: phosphate starvation-inducible protein PhoH [Verrucomicrobiales bacterium]|nr:phosphate starvation-inducible protein PhoH [Verrucomicrobiales bacterium]|tara:strand:+ start:3917 stop:4873 length:957 start_codon:yes stop_codon:yes gene_type:complete